LTHPAAGALHSPAVFDSVIFTGRNPAILFSAGWFMFIQENEE